MSAKTERLRFLRASKESLNRDIESLEKRGGSDSLPDYKEQLKKLEAEIARVEAQPEMNQDWASAERNSSWAFQANKLQGQIDGLTSNIKMHEKYLRKPKLTPSERKHSEDSIPKLKASIAKLAKRKSELLADIKNNK